MQDLYKRYFTLSPTIDQKMYIDQHGGRFIRHDFFFHTKLKILSSHLKSLQKKNIPPNQCTQLK